MNHFDVIASTVRDGVTIDAIEFAIDGAPPATAYLLGNARGVVQPLAVAFHDERGDKATMLDDLKILASRGFLCLSIDSPGTRLGVIDRDPLAAFRTMLAIGTTAVALLQDQPDVREDSVALIGRGMGGEVAARVAALGEGIRVVVAIGALPRRSEFVAESGHALAVGLRHFHDPETTAHFVSQLSPHDLVGQLDASPDTSWLLQLADDDDRLSGEDRKALTLSIPRAVRVAAHPSMAALRDPRARRERLDFVTLLCG